MSQDVDGLLTSQLELYGRISRASENLKKAGAANITVGLIEARLEALNTNWKKFEAQHDKIIMSYWAVVAKHDYTIKKMPELTEEAYLQQKGQFLDALRDLKRQAGENSSVAAATTSHPPRTTLPRIQLPQFSGRYEDWPSFRDLFQSIIGKDTSTTPVEKLHYLKSSLKGEAELLIRNLTTTDENFERAWKALTDFFDNKRLLVRSYISQVTALQKLKGESASELRKLYHCMTSTAGSLESIGRPITHGEDLFVHLIVELLDSRSRRDWETVVSETADPPSYVLLQQFLERRLHTLESLQPVKAETSSPKSSANPARQSRALHVRKQEFKRDCCSMCHQDHYILRCNVYQGKPAYEKKRHIEVNNLCLNCLGRHKLSECKSQKTCSTCGERHHTSVHDACTSSEVTRTSHFAVRPPKAPVAVLLATARVRVADRNGILHATRALIDQGSEVSLISESLAQRLRLPRKPTSTTVLGIGGVRTASARGLITFQVSALRGGSPIAVSALILPKITSYDGGIKADLTEWSHLNGLELADPDFLAVDPVDILLGANVYAAILQEGLRKGAPDQPVAQHTSLGWILSGVVDTTVSQRTARTFQCRTDDELISLVRSFWQQDELPTAAAPLTAAEQKCEESFVQTHARTESGRYIVRLPVISPLPDLSATRASALRVLSSMERRFSRNNELRQLYVEFMRQYEDLDHMTPTQREEGEVKRVSYLPHHGVMRESSTTTKLRVVFNGSTTIPTGESLNHNLLVGPNLLPSLADVLLRWRLHRYVFVTDVEKMYRQILVHPDDRDLQRIIWRYKEQDEPREYRLNTVTYGLACAPFLAMRTLRQLADDETEQYPQGAAVLRRDVYMDDILTGASTLLGAQELQQQLIELCTAGGFPLRKWSSNDTALLANVPAEHRMQHELRAWRPNEAHATLGLQWHPGTDSFSFSTRTITLKEVTKRSVLSLTARLFDPLGWIAPAVVRAKIAFQTTWLLGLDWDEQLDEKSALR